MHSFLPVFLLSIFIHHFILKQKNREKRPIAALLAIFAAVILFWAVFKQNGSALTYWADRYTDREVSGYCRKVFNGLILAQKLHYKKDSVALYDEQFRLQKEDGKVLKEYNYPSYFRNFLRNEHLQMKVKLTYGQPILASQLILDGL